MYPGVCTRLRSSSAISSGIVTFRTEDLVFGEEIVVPYSSVLRLTVFVTLTTLPSRSASVKARASPIRSPEKNKRLNNAWYLPSVCVINLLNSSGFHMVLSFGRSFDTKRIPDVSMVFTLKFTDANRMMARNRFIRSCLCLSDHCRPSYQSMMSGFRMSHTSKPLKYGRMFLLMDSFALCEVCGLHLRCRSFKYSSVT